MRDLPKWKPGLQRNAFLHLDHGGSYVFFNRYSRNSILISCLEILAEAIMTFEPYLSGHAHERKPEHLLHMWSKCTKTRVGTFITDTQQFHHKFQSKGWWCISNEDECTLFCLPTTRIDTGHGCFILENHGVLDIVKSTNWSWVKEILVRITFCHFGAVAIFSYKQLSHG